LRGDLGGEKRGVGDGPRDLEQQVEVATSGAVVEPRAEDADLSLLPSQLAGDAADALDLLGGEAHVCVGWQKGNGRMVADYTT